MNTFVIVAIVAVAAVIILCLSIQLYLKNKTIQRIAKRQAEAEAANRAKSGFLAKVSHEIRTPMNAILGITEIQMQRRELPPETLEALGEVYNSGYVLLNIINNILDLSKIEAGKQELMPVIYDVVSLLNDTVQLHGMQYDSKPIEFIIQVDEHIPSMLFGDELRIKQILNNLLSNAFKYTNSGEVLLSVSVDTAAEAGQIILVVCVRDTGQGMTQDQVGKLFDEYTRFNLEANRTIQGTGLGLTITKQLVAMMDGEIFVESELHKGSVFTVRLPQGTVGSEVLGQCHFGKTSLLKKPPLVICDYMPYGRVLIVDDVESNLYVARGLMLPYGLSIETVTSGFDAVEKINSGITYDIIFMDYYMPKMDGMEAAKIIRSLGYTHPIVALTANAVAGQKEMLLANGFDGFISKPIDLRQLNDTLNKLIRNKYPAETVEAAQRLKEELAHHRSDSAPLSPVNPQLAAIFIRDAEKAFAVLETLQREKYRRNDDVQTFVITIHAMKSALVNIGETALHDHALKLEQAGLELNIAAIESEVPVFLNALQAVVDKLRPAADYGANH
ncbi:MAG: ATP-binding protein [Treponema sp.]|nr:ATP-binding protein [Treponema sp.]